MLGAVSVSRIGSLGSLISTCVIGICILLGEFYTLRSLTCLSNVLSKIMATAIGSGTSVLVSQRQLGSRHMSFSLAKLQRGGSPIDEFTQRIGQQAP